MSWAVLLLARSENLLECLLARKRKSGPSRCGDALASISLACSLLDSDESHR